MRVIMGIAPSSNSVFINEEAEPWCKSTDSGKKVRCLRGDGKHRFANVVDKYPGKRSKGQGDLTPSPTEGYKSLLKVIREEKNLEPVDVLLLGLTYWKKVLGLKSMRSDLDKNMWPLPVAAAIPWVNEDVKASLYLFPHPRNWTSPKRRGDQPYGNFLAENLATQPNKRWSGSTETLNKCDYMSVLAHFELGLDPSNPTSAKHGVCS